jgi:hypothetical protein
VSGARKLVRYGALSALLDTPASPASIDYEVSGGESGVIYSADGSPNVVGALTQVGCPVTGQDVLSLYKAAYTCPTEHPGFETNGVVIVEPYVNGPMGWKRLQVTLPAAEHSVATRILNSFS